MKKGLEGKGVGKGMGDNKVNTGRMKQMSFYDLLKKVSEERRGEAKAGTFNVDARVRAMLSEALKGCPLSRPVVAAKMGELLGREISKSQLDSWTAESKDGNKIHFDAAIAFCEVTNSLEPLQIAAEMLRCYLIKGKDALLAELGRMAQQEDELSKNKKLIKMKLGQMENKGFGF